MGCQIRPLVILGIGIACVIENQVVEFQENKVIARRHVFHNVWCCELTEIDSEATLVTESWNGRKARSKWWVNDAGDWAPKVMAKTLVKLKGLVQE